MLRVIYKLSNMSLVTVLWAESGTTGFNELVFGMLEGEPGDVLMQAQELGIPTDEIFEFINL
jgi:hypothetical protein